MQRLALPRLQGGQIVELTGVLLKSVETRGPHKSEQDLHVLAARHRKSGRIGR